MKHFSIIIKKFSFLFFKPLKNERVNSASSVRTGSIVNFGSGVKSLLNKRKKSAPEQEILRHPYVIDDLKIKQLKAHTKFTSETHMPKNMTTLSPTNKILTSYNIFLNESCSVEVSASQQNSTAQNILGQVRIRKKNLRVF
jgi:hypothetical protein